MITQTQDATVAVTPVSVSIIIPTRNRPELLATCLRAIVADLPESVVEILVINDGGTSVADVTGLHPRIRVLDTPGLGPAGARNLGIFEARGDICLFTDDDTLPQPGWTRAAIETMSSDPHLVGAVGRVESPTFDPLYEYSVVASDLGNFLTCNIAYRRSALLAVGGFDEAFPFAHAEDRDLGYRMQAQGAVRFVPNMLVVHPPRRTDWRWFVRRGRFIKSEQRLYRFHPQACPPRWGWRWGPAIRLAINWGRMIRDPEIVRGSPRRAARVVALAIGQVSLAVVTTARSDEPVVSQSAGSDRPLRVAWVGAEPLPGPGAHGVGWLLLERLAAEGLEIDCYTGPLEHADSLYGHLPNVRAIPVDTGWRYDRWYSNHRSSKLITGLGDNARKRRKVAGRLLDQNELERYDVIFQFSTIEVFGKLRSDRRDRPPLVLMPGTYAAGELHWVERERAISAECDTWFQRVSAEMMLRVRARRQRTDVKYAARIFAISRRFAQQLSADYGVDPATVTVIPNPVDIEEASPGRHRSRERPWQLLFVGRISARKGVELLVELSHRLGDLSGQLNLEIVGNTTLWSDYTPLLKELNPDIARYSGGLPHEDILAKLRDTDLYVHPAKFEPFGLTVAEALSCGVPVTVADCVGAAEDVSAGCCSVFRTDDIDDLERAVRFMVGRLEAGEGQTMAETARSEAVRLFSPEKIAAAAAVALKRTAIDAHPSQV